MTAPKPLYLNNDNNRLRCDAFIQLHFAPMKQITESDFSQTYVLKVDNEDVFVRMVDMVRIPFDQVGSVLTLPASGKESAEWRKDWLKTYPTTNANTMMAVYMYKRIDGEV